MLQRVRDALSHTDDNRARIHNVMTAYFDFVDGEDRAHQALLVGGVGAERERKEHAGRGQATRQLAEVFLVQLEGRAAVDPIIPGGGDAIRQAGLMYLGTADPRTPLASPFYADLHGLPPLLMQVGEDEVLLDDTLRVAERARAQGVDVTVHVEPEGFHVYQWLAPDAPESRAALEQIGGFVRDRRTIAAGRV